MDLVDAQEARRILDRLYGYEVSPVLWRKVMSGLSAGRVQSVATRLVVDRERERMAFRAASYWDLEGTFDAGEKHDQRMFPAKLHSVDGTRVARGSDFGQDGELTGASKRRAPRRSRAGGAGRRAARHGLHRALGRVEAVHPQALRAVPHHDVAAGGQPQARLRRVPHDVGGPAALRERLHHLHATDSTTLSETAVAAARAQARDLYGAEYVPDAPRIYASKVKNAQEAHEAIRPPATPSVRRPRPA